MESEYEGSKSVSCKALVRYRNVVRIRKKVECCSGHVIEQSDRDECAIRDRDVWLHKGECCCDLMRKLVSVDDDTR